MRRRRLGGTPTALSSHIVYEVDGKERTLDISSLISWRGEWYVVHLTGFK